VDFQVVPEGWDRKILSGERPAARTRKPLMEIGVVEYRVA